MGSEYPVMEVHPHWATKPEQMGSKDKFWYRDPDDPNECDWLFKYPTEHTGQHWAEKVAYEIARTEYQVLFRTALRKVDNLSSKSVEEVVSKIPGSWMTELSREFVVRLVDYSLSELRSLS